MNNECYEWKKSFSVVLGRFEPLGLVTFARAKSKNLTSGGIIFFFKAMFGGETRGSILPEQFPSIFGTSLKIFKSTRALISCSD